MYVCTIMYPYTLADLISVHNMRDAIKQAAIMPQTETVYQEL